MILYEHRHYIVNVLRPFSPSTTVQRLSVDYEALLKEHKNVKQKLEASKARSKTLSAEVKILKHQISTLMEKGKHDDEFVAALMVRN